MTATITISDRQFNKICELTSFQLHERSWLINGIGSATFSIGLSDPKLTPTNVAPGNIVTIRSDLGVPDWVGRMDEFTWSDQTGVQVFCNAREALLRGVYFDSKIDTTRDIGSWLHRMSTGRYPLVGVTEGYIEPLALPDDQKISGSGDFADAISQTVQAVDAEWAVDHNTGKFYLRKRLGTDRSNEVVLQEGEAGDVLASPIWKVDIGPLLWYVIAVGKPVNGGQGGTWTPHAAEWRDEEIYKFVGGDMRQKVITIPKNGTVDFLRGKAKEEVDKSVKSVFTLDLSISNNRRSLGKFFLGDTVGLNLATFAWGVRVKMRVLGFSMADEESAQARLVLVPENPRDLFKVFRPNL